MPQIKVKEVMGTNDMTGQKEALMTVTNEAITFLQATVNMYIQRDFGDKDDVKLQTIKSEVQQDLIDAHNILNPS